MTILNAHRNRLAIALTMLGVVAFASPAAGFAQSDSPGTGPIDVGACGVYESQADAQADLDANPDLAETLDADGNGVACEGGFDSPGTGPIDVGACGVYDSQADAQADLDADPSLAPELDGDGNGIACEGGYAGDDEDDANADDGADDASGDDAVSALPSTGSGSTTADGNVAILTACAFALVALAGLASGIVSRRVTAGR